MWRLGAAARRTDIIIFDCSNDQKSATFAHRRATRQIQSAHLWVRRLQHAQLHKNPPGIIRRNGADVERVLVRKRLSQSRHA